MWLIILIIVIIIGGIIGAIASNDDEKGTGCLTGMLTSGMGCGYLMLQIFIWGLGIAFLIWLFGLLFG